MKLVNYDTKYLIMQNVRSITKEVPSTYLKYRRSGAFYVCEGETTRDISSHLRDVYGIDAG